MEDTFIDGLAYFLWLILGYTLGRLNIVTKILKRCEEVIYVIKNGLRNNP